eukprot:314521-Hanusia_phi.AAC.1
MKRFSLVPEGVHRVVPRMDCMLQRARHQQEQAARLDRLVPVPRCRHQGAASDQPHRPAGPQHARQGGGVVECQLSP